MAFASEILTNGRTGGLMTRVAELRSTWAERRAKARVFRSTVTELNALTDRELDDLGISRSNIREIAREAAYGA